MTTVNLPGVLRHTYHLADVDPSHPIRRAADEIERLSAELEQALRRLHLQDAECAHMRAERDAARAECDALREANERFGKRQAWWTRTMFESESNRECLQAERDALRAERDALKAARIAYASEFPPNADGEPDVGNIHANIRLLKKQCAERGGLLREALDRENRYVMPLYRDINYAARLRRALDIDPNDYYKIEDTGS